MSEQQDLFCARRNTNRNEVHYAIRTEGETAKPLGHAPVIGYWQMLEKGPDVTEPILLIEQVAFGIGHQCTEGDQIYVKLAALPDREIRIARDADDPKKYRAFIQIDGAEAELTGFYAHAEPGFLLPKVKYLDIQGLRAGVQVSERILK